jgi:hypothetical protein
MMLTMTVGFRTFCMASWKRAHRCQTKGGDPLDLNVELEAADY